MKIRPEQLQEQLSKDLAPIFLIHGAEPLLIQESADKVRSAAYQQGYTERDCFTVEAGFDWSHLLVEANSGSLFSSRRLIEVRLGNSKPGDKGSQALYQWAERPPPDIVLLLSADKLDSGSQNSRWFKALDKAGINLTIWPMNLRQLPRWLEQRLHAHGLQPMADVLELLSARCEGNLLAAKQEIDKLALLLGHGPVTVENILELSSDQARFSIYDLADAALSGQAARVVRIIPVLKAEGVEPILALWALHREIQTLNRLHYDIQRGLTLPAALTRHTVWEKRKPLFTQALNRINDRECKRLLRACAELDGIIKGASFGNPWQGLSALSLRLSGQPLTTDLLLPRAATEA